jgi:glycosyltransferase involved in cell wall biosynthesis
VPIVAHVVKTQAIAGAENHLLKLLPGLAEGGWDVKFITIFDRSGPSVSPEYERAVRHLADSGVEVARLDVAGKADPSGSLKIADLLRGVRPDLVHTHLPYADLFGSTGARLAGIRRVVSSRHHDYSTSPADRRKYRRYYRIVNPLQDAVIAISRRIADLCRFDERRDPQTVHTVWYGCEDQAVDRSEASEIIRRELRLGPSVRVMGTIARLIPWKGHRYAIEALAGLRASGQDVVWLVIGEGPERPALEAHARAMRISDSVRFLGHRNDIPTIMASLDLLVHPTSGEGFGLVLLEAMTQATPIVATRVGALPEIVEDGVTGVLVPPRDAPALSASIERMLGDSAILRSMGDAGRQRFERLFTINRMVTETLEVYEKLLDGRCAS